MATYYWDTSALAKHYHLELGTQKVDKLHQEADARHIISRLAVTEFFSVFAGKQRAGLITATEFQQLCRRFLADTRRRLPWVARLRAGHLRQAETLLRKYGPVVGQGIRTLDSIQLAVALDLQTKEHIDAVVCADARLRVVAQSEGFSVTNPEIP